MMKRHDSTRQERLDVHLEEYKQLSSEIKMRLTFQQNLTNYQLIATGIMVTIGINLLDQIQSESLRFYLILGPIVFLIFAWIHSTHDIMIINIAKYINNMLKPKLVFLLRGDNVLSFESFIKTERQMMLRKWGPLAIFGQEFILQLVFPLVFFLIYTNKFFIDDIYLMIHSEKIL